ncbi:Apolipoprotein D precursor, putative [Pediculus humanus corporis]|uniref:Apolipoprotein D, putative n=1 Tax=Pediculus humanus subsp. corporis TaxID=121224 RepID=E0VT70_PEDHC|nr:Apolipoprotein D precursor, putative [Pediculus humanus corporis]EEB16576.1 Apolipoprotein D precursor, putative [Pediculus humanus corporis]
MKKLLLLIATFLTCTLAQVPGFGWGPDYSPMADFDLDRYQGVWYEAERYFTVLEAGSRCVRSNYTKGSDGKFRVSNEITNRLTGIRRVLDGVVQNIGKGGEGKISVKYNTLPVPVDTQYSVLDTDYDNYSVVWSCSSLGPLNTQNAWVMTRERLAPGKTLQTAYGILDKYKISRTFFVKTDQNDCLFSEPLTAEPPVDTPEDEVNEKQKKETNDNSVRADVTTSVKEPSTTRVEQQVQDPVNVKQGQVEQQTLVQQLDNVEHKYKPVVVHTLNAESTQFPVVHQVETAPKVETVYLEPLKQDDGESSSSVQKVSEKVVNLEKNPK